MSNDWSEHRCINWPQAEVQVDRALEALDVGDSVEATAKHARSAMSLAARALLTTLEINEDSPSTILREHGRSNAQTGRVRADVICFCVLPPNWGLVAVIVLEYLYFICICLAT